MDLSLIARFQSDVGCQRSVNEDSVGFFNPGGGRTLTGPGVVAVVADGMGGHSAGEVASAIATEAVGRIYFENGGDPGTALLQAFAEANREIYSAATESPEKEGMGTTCTALALRDGRAWAVHVGDSRLYLMRDGALFRMTEDDSMVMDMVRKGLLSAQDARGHADRNVILRALGTRPEVSPSSWDKPFALRAGDRFLLCTDGLHDLVSDEEILEALEAEPRAACSRLIETARERGAPDNVSVGVIAVVEEDGSEAPRATRQVAVEG